jgi:hypothetical protein
MKKPLSLTLRCRQCNKQYVFTVDHDDYNRWIEGELIQRAMPYLNADQREMLISKTCGPCFDKMFGPEQ